MSSLATSSPVSASTLAYLIRWPVFRLSWLNEIFSDSEVAGYSATGQVTSERRRKPFQLARGAMVRGTPLEWLGLKTIGGLCFRQCQRRDAIFFRKIRSPNNCSLCVQAVHGAGFDIAPGGDRLRPRFPISNCGIAFILWSLEFAPMPLAKCLRE